MAARGREALTEPGLSASFPSCFPLEFLALLLSYRNKLFVLKRPGSRVANLMFYLQFIPYHTVFKA